MSDDIFVHAKDWPNLCNQCQFSHVNLGDGKKPVDMKDLDDLLKKMGKGYKVFKPSDFAGMSEEEKMKKFKDEM
jgi:hypothetical protein